MTYKKLFEQDSEYQSIINEFNAAKNELQRKANYGTYKYEALVEEGKAIYNEFSQAVKDYTNKRKSENQEIVNSLENAKKSIGYAERQADAKEIEMYYKLADDHELKEIAQNLNTKDLLEINLLRMELKSRGLEKEDQAVKRYTITNKLNGLDEAEQKEYEYRKSNLAIFNTMGDRHVVIDGELKQLNSIQNELRSIAKLTDKQ